MSGESPSVAAKLSPAASRGGRTPFYARHFTLLACLMLALAGFNLTFRLGQEFLTEWDESLYATTASEALDDGHWIGTTFDGALDYYNTKPPLNVWLIALAFKTFGKGLAVLRLMSAVSAWLTVAVLVFWARRSVGPATALLAGLVLATSFGFIHIHAGRSANTDALFTLLVLLTVVVLWAEAARPWARAWLGPLLAATFLLRGMAVLMPLMIVVGVWAISRPQRGKSWWPTLAGVALFVLPVATWMIARFQIDRWQFIDRLFFYDFVARTTDVIEDHPGGPLYYLNILQKHHFDWIFAAAIALLLAPVPWAAMRALVASWWRSRLGVLLAVWTAVTLIEPTLMRTKLPWYLNSFYPVFAVGVAWLVVRGLSQTTTRAQTWRTFAMATAFVVAFGVAEGKLMWYSFEYRDLGLSDQGVVLAEITEIAGHRVYREQADHAGKFVTAGLAGAEPRYAADPEAFLNESRPGDFLVAPKTLSDPDLEFVRSNGHFSLYRHGHIHRHTNGQATANGRD
jgi:4-amino-4-deoxy-L-arabinose transferase-like glycosyltransferase